MIGVGYSWVAGLADNQSRTKAMSILGAFISAAAALAFAVGPLLRGVMSVSWMFLAGAILLSMNSLYILFFLKDARGGEIAAIRWVNEGYVNVVLLVAFSVSFLSILFY